MLRNKVFSFINISGLALGMAGAVLLLLNIQYELSVDQFHEKKDHIYKAFNKAVMDGRLQCWDISSPPLAPALKKDFPEIKEVARTCGTDHLLAVGDKKLQAGGSYADPAFLGMFSFPLVKGSPAGVLRDAHAIVITEQLAKKLFGDEDPVNKTILADNSDNLVVTGVLKDLPDNTQFRFDYLMAWDFLRLKGWENPSWDNHYLNTYAELQPGADIAALNKKIAGIGVRESGNKEIAQVFLHPFNKLYLYGRFENGQVAGGRIENLRMLGILAGIILLIACINFMNLSTARSEKRGKEVGIRKVIGARRGSLVLQFIGESVLMAAVAGGLALVAVQVLLPAFSVLAKVRLSVAWQSPYFWLAAAGFVLMTGILAGSYPAFYLSSFKPVKVLKGILKNGNALVTPRKILVVTQFVCAVFLINFTIIFQKQINYGQNRATGYIKENLVFHAMTDDLRKNYQLVKNELLGSGVAAAVCKSSTIVTRNMVATWSLDWAGKDPNAKTSFNEVAERGGFVATSGLTLVAGRDIDVERFPTDTASCMLNEAGVKVTGFKDPIGQIIKSEGGNWKVVGVVKDFLIDGPGEAMKPMFIKGSSWANYISIRLNDHNPSAKNLQDVEAILKKYNPRFITEYQFADVDYSFKFKQARDVATLMNSFTLVAIFISCLGLFGLATYMAENRVREIGVRKVLGASVAGITSLLAKDFLKLVVIAIVIASPPAWWFMHFFLQHFDYRTGVSGWIPVAAGGAAVFIALFTVSFQSARAALANPVKSLRTE